MKVVIATTKSWNVRLAKKLGYTVVTTKQELLKVKKADWIFFPHWSWIIPPEVHEKFRCVVFHMTDLPYGRGGSPLQNLIKRKRYKTKVSALLVDGGLDTGPIYLKREVDLSIGNAEGLYEYISALVFHEMIPYILKYNPEPEPQRGRVTKFKRLKEHELKGSMWDMIDTIRMLDAEGYPRAYLQVGDVRIQFNSINQRTNTGEFTLYENPRRRRPSR